MKRMTAINQPFFKYNLLFSLMFLGINSVQAGVVRGDVDYQQFRDFAENKGQFHLNASNVEIFDKNGQSVGTMLQDISMIDLAVASRINGIATLVKPQYIVSVQHNRGYESVQFGEHSNVNPDSHHFNYQITNRHVKTPGAEIKSWHRDDYHTPRLHKLVTEVAPIPIANETNISAFLDKNKYTNFVRAGSGIQRVIDEKGGEQRNIEDAYHFMTGGSMLDLKEVFTNPSIPGTSSNTLLRFDGMSNLFEHPLGIMQRSGDSGSGVFAWDVEAKRWVYIASVQSSTDSNSFSTSHLGYVDENEKASIAGTVIGNEQTLMWLPSNNTSTISVNGQTLLNVDLMDVNLAEREGINNGHWSRPRQDHGKTFTIAGENNTLQLTDSINQGSGAIYFSGNTTVEGLKKDTTWLGAGVSIDKDKTVTWKVSNPDKDRLSKIGEGTLHIQGVGKNLGSISVGDGTVILDQRADENNQKQAFSEVGIVSGRATVVLNSTDQVDPNNIYFGFRGGRLDTNGHDLKFTRIQNADDGARIVNHNLNKATTVTIGKELLQPLLTEKDIIWVNGRSRSGHIHINAYPDGHTDYYVLTSGTINSFLPERGKSNNRWLLLASNDRNAAARAFLERENAKRTPTAGIDTFSGILGETDTTKNNGQLNFVYDPLPKDDVYMLNGGANLNGNIIAKNGNLMLSGRPTPYAYDHLNRTEVIKDDDWLNRTFNMTTLAVQDNATAYIGRNVSVVNANLSVSQNATLTAGFINGQTPVCIRSDYSGTTTCTTPTYNGDILNSIPVTAINGNVSLVDNATLTLGKAHLAGKLSATAETIVNLSADSVWDMTANSDVGHLNLTAGSVVNLNNATNANTGNYHTLNILGNLTGEGLFNYQTNLTQFKGDKVNVQGNASGTHRLNVNNTGKEPTKTKEHLTLLTVKGTDTSTVKLANKDEQVDLGAYRYSLRHEGENYYLWSPVLEKEIDDEAERLEKERQAELARQEAERLEKERQAELARQEAERLEKERQAELARQEAERLEKERQAELARQEAERLEKERQAELARQEAERLEKERQAELARQEAERLEKERQAELARQEAERLEKERQAELARQEAERLEKERQAELVRQEAERLERERQAELARQEAERLERERQAELARQEAERLEKERQAELARQEAERLERERQAELARQEAERLEKERQAELVRQEAERLERERQAELARQEAERLERERQAELARQEAERLEKERQAELARQEAERLERERQAELARQEAERLEKERQAELVRQEAERLERERQAELARQEAERLERERQAELARQEAERLERERQAELVRQEAERLERERQAELARQEAERLEKERQAELARQEAERLEKERQAELARQEAERLEKERQAELARQEAERLEKERQAELARQEAERLEKERQAELARQEAERLEKERQAELARQEAERLEKERQAELARQEAERLEKERQAELARQEAERLEKERQAELARQEAERLEKERQAELARQEAERLEKERQAELARQEAERLEKERQAELARQEAERLEKERQAELARQEAERLEKERQAEEARRKALAQKQQSELISRYANTALSDLSSQVNSVIHVGDGLNHHLLDNIHSGGVWLNVNRYNETEHGSAYYRDYKKQETLTQIGADTVLDTADGQLLVGVAYSHSEGTNRFADNASSESKLDMLSVYSKLNYADNSFVSVDVGYGRTDSELRSEGEDTKLARNIATAGVNVGTTVSTKLVNIKPSVGVRYHYLEGRNYNLNGANIALPDANILSYRAGVSLEKSFSLGNGIELTPSISSHYVDTMNEKSEVKVNGHSLRQAYGRYGHHEVGVKVGGKQWSTEIHAGRSEGSEVNTQNSGGMKFSYKW
ncbi:S6 family peptidase [Moraxella sp. ZY210820]|uniref:S6 family peptidase n=1 Tax=Moraxella sp. ZY210820 TaxID=2904123 RepID=UPI00272F401F|nr:S6 family peptidase [Moraxella sp. ZY210820]WLF83732.1 autotransporter outer membrane beta-barrel domain-containing protein [Moraxella sp. ZY210820]